MNILIVLFPSVSDACNIADPKVVVKYQKIFFSDNETILLSFLGLIWILHWSLSHI